MQVIPGWLTSPSPSTTSSLQGEALTSHRPKLDRAETRGGGREEEEEDEDTGWEQSEPKKPIERKRGIMSFGYRRILQKKLFLLPVVLFTLNKTPYSV